MTFEQFSTIEDELYSGYGIDDSVINGFRYLAQDFEDQFVFLTHLDSLRTHEMYREVIVKLLDVIEQQRCDKEALNTVSCYNDLYLEQVKVFASAVIPLLPYKYEKEKSGDALRRLEPLVGSGWIHSELIDQGLVVDYNKDVIQRALKEYVKL